MTMFRGATTLALVLGLTLAASPAQLGGQGRGDSVPVREGAPRRAEAERRFREGVARVVKERLELTDEQMRLLSESNGRFGTRRQALFQKERQLRVAIRREVREGKGADEGTVSSLIDQIIGVQRERLDLLAAEQRDLARFLSPVQRAKYLELQDQVRRRVDRAVGESRRRRPEGGRRP
jgi:hypothetical protein